MAPFKRVWDSPNKRDKDSISRKWYLVPMLATELLSLSLLHIASCEMPKIRNFFEKFFIPQNLVPESKPLYY
jgi:hypothetical protein